MRNVCLANIASIARALGVEIAVLFSDSTVSTAGDGAAPSYAIRSDLVIECGFVVTPRDVETAAIIASKRMAALPFSLYRGVDLKTLSSIAGALFSEALAPVVGAIVNPIEKGPPDIIPVDGKDASEAALRNYGSGLEVKCTVGNVTKGSGLQSGQRRVTCISGLTWQAHHREVTSLLGLVVDFAGREEDDHRSQLQKSRCRCISPQG